MANLSHKRDTNARLFSRVPTATAVAGPLAVLATASAVGIGVATTGAGATSAASLSSALPPAVSGPVAGDTSPVALDLVLGDVDRRIASRSGARADAQKLDLPKKQLSKVEKMLRPKKVRKAIRSADLEQFATAPLNLWTAPGKKADKVGLLDEGKKLLVTGRSHNGRDEIVRGKVTRWVTAGYFSDEKPVAEPVEVAEEAAAPAAGATCTNGTSVPSGVSPNVVKVHAAVCAAFPGITTYGTFRSDGEHSQGIAIDIMVSGEEGYRVADFVRANASSLGVSYAIYAQRIWSVERAGEGWRGMASRGSATANHYDHVHVTTY